MFIVMLIIIISAFIGAAAIDHKSAVIDRHYDAIEFEADHNEMLT